ncbi:MAG: YibE/F family protein [Opitutales bacterium]|nr:YibE/F family protein [Opitutales bacterium]
MQNPRDLFVKDLITVLVFAAACMAALFIKPYNQIGLCEGSKEKAVVLQTDNSNVFTTGVVKRGEQSLKIKILSGKHSGQIFNGANILRAQMDLDKMFEVNDTVLAAVPENASPEKDTINVQDFYRTNQMVLLFGLFALLLIAFAGMTGLKALVSFVFSCVVIWKIVIPLCLDGANPIWVCMAAVFILSAAIIFLVAGFTRKGATSFLGTMLGVFASCITAYFFSKLFKINGAVMPYSQALLYSGFEDLNLADIYIGAIFLSSSGAVMDLSTDVAAGMRELVRRNPQIVRTKLLASGLNIGRLVVGTMSTTLLLAYSGGYITLMMTFAAQGVSPVDFLNNPYVASEAVKTLVGSFGLVLVAPFTALVGAFILKPKL